MSRAIDNPSCDSTFPLEVSADKSHSKFRDAEKELPFHETRKFKRKVIEIIITGGAIATLTVGAMAITALTPVVSLVAVPIFGIKSCRHWVMHRSLYHRTLTDQTRAQFGRVVGQDYTRWDGKSVKRVNTEPTWAERMHALMDAYPHGAPHAIWGDKNIDLPGDYSFSTKDDLEWLNREFKRRERKELLNSDLRMLRAFSKSLVPIVGLIWVFRTELSPGGASEIGCRVCMMMGEDSEETHWGWREAMNFHRKNVEIRMKNAIKA